MVRPEATPFEPPGLHAMARSVTGDVEDVGTIWGTMVTTVANSAAELAPLVHAQLTHGIVRKILYSFMTMPAFVYLMPITCVC